MFSRKSKIPFSMAVSILLLFGAGAVFIVSLQRIMVADKKSSLKKVSEQGSASIRTELLGNLDTLQAMSGQAPFSKGLTDRNLIGALKDGAKKWNFDFMEYADPSGSAVTDCGTRLSEAGRPYFNKAVRGVPNVSCTSGPSRSGSEELIFAVPVPHAHAASGALIAVSRDISQLKLTSRIVTGDMDVGYLLKSDGTILSGSAGDAGGNFFSLLQPYGRGKSLGQIKADFQNGTAGSGVFRIRSAPVAVSYAQIDRASGWIFLVTADYRREFASVSRILIISSILYVILATALLISSYYFFKWKKIGYESKVRSDEQKKYFAYADSLTNLPNRRGIKKQFEDWSQACQQDCRNGGALFLDIDNLRSVNYTFGYDSGDQLLCESGTRLKEAVGNRGIVGRTGNNEFTILIHCVPTEEELKSLIKKITAVLHEPYRINGIVIQPVCSIGAILFHGATAKQNIQFEDLWMRGEFILREAKEKHEGSYVLFNDDYGNRIDRQLQLERALKFSIRKNELLCYFQPQFNCITGKITGFESLVRWKSSNFGMIPPDQFIPMAEKSGFIKEVGHFMIERSFAFAKKMEGRRLTISFNASPMELLETNYIDYVIKRFRFYGLTPNSVAIEITESCLIESFEGVTKKLQVLKQNGIQIYLDDFGTGFSSLTYLKNLPISAVKIDKSFIDEIVTKDVEKDIVRMIITLAHRLSLKVIAEGVETEDQIRCVSEAGCHLIQGYYISRPIPEQEIPALMDRLRQQSPGFAGRRSESAMPHESRPF